MAVPVALEGFGPGLAGGIVAEWYVADGTPVDTGDAVCRVESGFIAIEVEAGGPGVLRHHVAEGGTGGEGLLGLIVAPGEQTQPESPAPRVEPDPGTSGPVESEREAAAAPPHPEFEEALVEAVVVPFPKKFSGAPGRAWDPVPGDAVEFDSSLFGESPHDRTAALKEPGGSIPGLPLWEQEQDPPVEMETTFTRIQQEARATAQVLTMTMVVNLGEAERMRGAFEREWGEQGPAPMLEDVVFRAIAWALEDTPFAGGTGAMLVATTECDLAFAVREPAARSFRDGVTARAAVGDEAFESAAWLFVSLASLGVSSATPRLEPGRHMSFALGARDDAGRASLKIAYDSALWSEGSAARLLARVRDILDLPYAMLT
ncbi:MAG: hypothetical protein IT301_01420 [Dehalococcoidia bacterium]|nr:hypothetical protein [Dehalococcoidia bacterium]